MTTKPVAEKLKWPEQARILSEALPNMRRFSGKTIVIKFGGHAMGDSGMANLFARDIVLLRHVGINPIVVHGGGPQIGQMLQRLNIESKFVDGLRITDKPSIEIVEMVLSGSINKSIVSSINLAGATAIGISGKDGNLILAKRLIRPTKQKNKEAQDLGLVGEPTKINPNILAAFANNNIIPVIAPIGMDQNGETLNINADTVAGAIASAVKAARLYMLTDVPGLLDKSGSLVSEVSISRAEKYIEQKVISGGMIPKIETCISAMKSGVDCAAIIDGRIEHSLLIELFTEGGAGTLIRAK